MRLSDLRGELKRELSTDEATIHFKTAKLVHEKLGQHPTIFSVLSVLASRKDSGYPAQQQILRILVTESQRNPEQRVWRQALLYAFLPSLVRIRKGTIEGNHRREDLDGALWTAFLEVVHRYPLHRTGSFAKGITLDTRKRFYTVLRQEQEQQRRYFDLVAYANEQVEADKPESFTFNPAEHQEPSPESAPDADELACMWSILEGCGEIARPDLDLIWATDVQGVTIREFMDERSLATGDATLDDQTFQRLKKRRQRARSRLSKALQHLRQR